MPRFGMDTNRYLPLGFKGPGHGPFQVLMLIRIAPEMFIDERYECAIPQPAAAKKRFAALTGKKHPEP